jgi:hypothetical protein
MKMIAAALISGLIIPITSFGNDYFNQQSPYQMNPKVEPTYVQSIIKIDVAKFSPAELEIKTSLLHTLIERGWEIAEQTRYKVTAKYKDTTMDVTIDGSTVEFREVSPPHKSDYGWISRAAEGFLKEVEYYYHVKLAEKMINNGSK